MTTKASTQRLTALGMLLALLLSLTGCGSADGTATESVAIAARSTAESLESRASELTTELTSQGAETETDTGIQTDANEPYNGLFDTQYVHTIEVTIDEADWDDLLANPLSKTKYKTTVCIDGETLESVSFATKGNTSLSSVAADSDSNRYSFKLNFGKYDKEQSYHGLNKLNLNNCYADATYLKDYLSYALFQQAGVDAPLVSYVWLRINGQDHGLYLAIEDISEGWLDRTQNSEGILYKPETEGLDQAGKEPGPGGFPGGFPGTDGHAPGGFPEGFSDEGGQNPGGFPGGFPGTDGQAPGNFPGGFPGAQNGGEGVPSQPDGMAGATPSGNAEPGAVPWESNSGQPNDGDQNWNGPGRDRNGQRPMDFGSNAKGADLRYTDDNPDSYADIFDNDETDMDEGAEERVISALKLLSEGKAAEALDTDEVIRYFVVHNFVLNYDSYTGNMLHNYYLYEKDGKLSMLPWDYNLAFGGFGGFGGGPEGEARDKMGESSDATSLLNTGIDTPLSGATEDSRPMWGWIIADESYLSQYHAACDELLRDYFENGCFDAELDCLYKMLRPYVEKDPSAFYSVEEFDAAVETLRQVCKLRAESIRKQLDGALSKRSTEQDEAARIDASKIALTTRAECITVHRRTGSRSSGKSALKSKRPSSAAAPPARQKGLSH